MDNQPLVSIIIPSYNRSNFIKGCIDSIYNQTYKHIECIVVDGSSSDGTIEILNDYCSKYNSFRFISEHDNGMYYAINKGISMAKGDVIAYLNTDDRYFDWTIQSILPYIEKCDAVFGDLMVITKGGWYLQFYRPFDLNYYTKYHTIAQPTVFFRRTVIEKIGLFDTKFKLIADCDYWLKIGVSGLKITRIQEILAAQIDHAQTLREQHKLLLNKEFNLLYKKYSAGFTFYDKIKKKLLNKALSRYLKLKFLAVLNGNNRNNRWQNFYNYISRPSISWADYINVLKPGFFLTRNKIIKKAPESFFE